MNQTRQTKIVLDLVIVLMLSGCGGLGSNDAGSERSGGDAGPGKPSQAKQADQSNQNGSTQSGQQLIRTGTVTLEVANYTASRSNLTDIATEHGGYVSDSTQRVHHGSNDTWTTGRVVYHVPANNLSTFLGAVKSEGDVQSSSTNTTDVTDQVTDLEARLTNLRAERDRLRTLYNQSNDTEAVLAVEKRLSEVQGRIERLQAQHRNLEEKVALSTVTVELREPELTPKQEPDMAWYDTGIVSAFLDSIGGVITTLRAIVVALAYLAPYLIVFGLPLLAVGYVFIQRKE